MKISSPNLDDFEQLHKKTIEGILNVVRNTVGDEKIVNEVVEEMENDVKRLISKLSEKEQ
jgi:hypothetical protein